MKLNVIKHLDLSVLPGLSTTAERAAVACYCEESAKSEAIHAGQKEFGHGHQIRLLETVVLKRRKLYRVNLVAVPTDGIAESRFLVYDVELRYNGEKYDVICVELFDEWT